MKPRPQLYRAMFWCDQCSHPPDMIEHTAIHKGPSIGREAAKAMLDSGEVGLSPFKESTILCQVTCHGEKTNLTITFTAAEAFVSGGEKMHVFTPPSQALLENHG